MIERLQKYMAGAGIASRRKCEEFILQGQVKVNNSVITKLGTKVDPQKDLVEVKGKLIQYQKKKKYSYILLNKPKGYLTSLYDPFGRPIVIDLLKGLKEKVYPVGRLDFNSEGLLILTNDGDLAYALTHPAKEVEKVYLVKLKGRPSPEKLKLLSEGVTLENNYRIAPCSIYVLKITNGNTMLKIKIREGKKRQIRKMAEHIGHFVLELRRIQLGPIYLKGIKPGDYRSLTKEEIKSLKKIV